VAPASTSTAPVRITYRAQGRNRLARRIFLALLGTFLLLGLLNVFGSKSGMASATANGYTLRVTFPQATRSSLPVKWLLVVTHPGGFPGPVRIGIPEAYFNLFDFNNFYPTPSGTLNEGGTLIMVFDPPAGDTLTVLLDARTQAGLRTGMGTTTAVVDHSNRTIVSVHYTTRVVP
jgi:hypothetical protein